MCNNKHWGVGAEKNQKNIFKPRMNWVVAELKNSPVLISFFLDKLNVPHFLASKMCFLNKFL